MYTNIYALYTYIYALICIYAYLDMDEIYASQGRICRHFQRFWRPTESFPGTQSSQAHSPGELTVGDSGGWHMSSLIMCIYK